MPQGLHLETNNKNMAWLDMAGDNMEDEQKLHLKDHEWNECMVHSKYPVAMQIVQIPKNCKLLNKQNIEFLNSVHLLQEYFVLVDCHWGINDINDQNTNHILAQFLWFSCLASLHFPQLAVYRKLWNTALCVWGIVHGDCTAWLCLGELLLREPVFYKMTVKLQGN